jgi:hypothetical protein
MASLRLRALYQLHKIDAAIASIRGQAAALDPGRRIQAELAKLNEQLTAERDEHTRLKAQLTDLEVQQKGIEEKLKKIDREVYGGKVVNPREIENLQKEIELLKRQTGVNDEGILKLWDLLPPAERKVEETAKKVEALKAELAVHREKVMKERAKLEQDFKAHSAQRPEAAKKVDPALLSRYESIRQKHEGLGMTTVDKNGMCSLCGTVLPRKNVEAAIEDHVVVCEACHRILYASEGLI